MLSLSRRSTIRPLHVLVTVIACFFGAGASATVDPQPPDRSATQLWFSRSSGGVYDAGLVCRDYPNLKRVYVPLFQLVPRLSGKGLDLPREYLARQKQQYAVFHAHSVEVVGIFEPLQLDVRTGAIEPSWLERPLQAALEPSVTPTHLSMYSQPVAEYCVRRLQECLSEGKVDGVVLDLTYPNTVLLGYGTATREHFVGAYHFDPIDVDYPLGISQEVRVKDQELVDLIVRDRFRQADALIESLVNVSASRGVKAVVFAPLSAYQYPATTRAAVGTDWINLLLEDRRLTAILSHLFNDSLVPSSLTQCFALLKKLGVDGSRTSVLLVSKDKDAQAVQQFERGQRLAPGSIRTIAYLSKN